MGHRHNRRRSRQPPLKLAPKFLKPHSYHSVLSAHDLIKQDEVPTCKSLSNLQARHWRQRYVQWQERQRREKAEISEQERCRVFGGEVGDEVSLCYPMLMVVFDLFGGIDYEDP